MLTTYTIFLVILCILQITLSSWCWAKRESLLDTADDYVQEAWDNRDKLPGSLDAVQLVGHCCGKSSWNDFNGAALPASCCGSTNTSYTCSSNDAYQTGCFVGFKDYFRRYTNWVIIYGYIVAAIELAGVILACCLKGTLNRHNVTY